MKKILNTFILLHTGRLASPANMNLNCFLEVNENWSKLDVVAIYSNRKKLFSEVWWQIHTRLFRELGAIEFEVQARITTLGELQRHSFQGISTDFRVVLARTKTELRAGMALSVTELQGMALSVTELQGMALYLRIWGLGKLNLGSIGLKIVTRL